jgi:formylmethanofuran dehydrogenase subunit E
MLEAPEIFAQIYARHGHRCPMSTLGGRLGLAAIKIADDCTATLQLTYCNRTCALDGIAVVTGCSEEAATLKVKNDGRHALTVKMADKLFELELTAAAMQIAGRYRSLCNRLEHNWDELAEAEQARRRIKMDTMLDELLPQLWHADDELLIQKVAR